MADDRYVLVLNGLEWYKRAFTDLKKGDVFKLFESDGKPVKDEKGQEVLFALSDVYKNPDGIDTIKCRYEMSVDVINK